MIQQQNSNSFQERAQFLLSKFKTYQDFPIKGKIFKDIGPILKDPAVLREAIDLQCELIKNIDFDYLVALDSRGFLFATGIGLKLNKGVIMARKPSKLPGETVSIEYSKNYGKDTICIQTGLIEKGKKCIIVDDVLATGGSILSTGELIKMLGAIPIASIVLYEFKAMNGKQKLEPEITSFAVCGE